jgi:hypothetical protein
MLVNLAIKSRKRGENILKRIITMFIVIGAILSACSNNKTPEPIKHPHSINFHKVEVLFVMHQFYIPKTIIQ